MQLLSTNLDSTVNGGSNRFHRFQQMGIVKVSITGGGLDTSMPEEFTNLT